jgi:hypothetical protein
MYEATLKSAMEYSNQRNIEQWVHEYLCKEGNNIEFSHGLKLEKREYEGPKLMNLDLLSRIYGPEPGMKYSISEDNKEQIIWFWSKVNGILERYKAGNWDMPPLIIQDCGGEYVLNDGNHRFEALKILDKKEYWVILWRTIE